MPGQMKNGGNKPILPFMELMGPVAWEKNVVERAIRRLESFDHQADPLRQIATYIIERKNNPFIRRWFNSFTLAFLVDLKPLPFGFLFDGH